MNSFESFKKDFLMRAYMGFSISSPRAQMLYVGIAEDVPLGGTLSYFNRFANAFRKLHGGYEPYDPRRT